VVDVDPAVPLKVALCEPAGTVTDEGVATKPLLHESATGTLEVAFALRLTVHVVLAPVTRLEGLQASDASEGAAVGASS
jgi:hypothetical protein